MPGAPGGRLGALFVAVVLGLLGCATADRLPPMATSLRADEVGSLVRRWEAEWQAFPGLRAVVDLMVRSRGRNDRTAAILLLSPTHLRLEVVTAFGLPALVAAAGPERVTVFRPLERKAWTARPTAEALGRWLGAPLPPDLLIGLLIGRVPLPPDPAAVRLETSPSPHLVYDRGPTRHRVWVTPQGQPARLTLEDGDRLVVTFEWAVSGNLQSVRVEVPGRGAEMSLRYDSAEFVAAPPEAFELMLPVDVRVEQVD